MSASYAVQWWVFSVVAVVGWIFLIRRELRDAREGGTGGQGTGGQGGSEAGGGSGPGNGETGGGTAEGPAGRESSDEPSEKVQQTRT